jgi:hypothetical protein
MFSKAFSTWIVTHDIRDNAWSDFLPTYLDNQELLHYSIINCFNTWYNIQTKDDLKDFTDQNPDCGVVVVDHMGTITVIHHLMFHSNGKILAYTTNKFHDTPIQLLFCEEFAKPIRPKFPITWKMDTPPKQSYIEFSSDDNGDDTTSIEDHQDDDSNSIIDSTTLEGMENDIKLTPKPKPRKSNKGLNIDKNIINSYVLIPPPLLGELLSLRQPFTTKAIALATNTFSVTIHQITQETTYFSAHQIISLLRTFKECLDTDVFFHEKTVVNQLRDDTMINDMLIHTFPPTPLLKDLEDKDSPLQPRSILTTTPSS